jgi:hypothetical protein
VKIVAAVGSDGANLKPAGSQSITRMRKPAPVLSAMVVLAACSGRTDLDEPVRIVSVDGLTPGSRVSCFGSPRAGGQLVSTSNATYAWIRDEVAVPDATTHEYVVRNADLGHALRCQMSIQTVEGQLTGTSEVVVAPVVDDGPPRLLHNGAGLMGGSSDLMVAALNKPAVIRDVGPSSTPCSHPRASGRWIDSSGGGWPQACSSPAGTGRPRPTAVSGSSAALR